MKLIAVPLSALPKLLHRIGSSVEHFNLPANLVIELGMQIEI